MALQIENLESFTNIYHSQELNQMHCPTGLEPVMPEGKQRMYSILQLPCCLPNSKDKLQFSRGVIIRAAREVAKGY